MVLINSPKQSGRFAEYILSSVQKQFIFVLLVAAIVSLGLGQVINSVFIMVVLLLNATIGTAQGVHVAVMHIPALNFILTIMANYTEIS